jgi:hypothetical protein
MAFSPEGLLILASFLASQLFTLLSADPFPPLTTAQKNAIACALYVVLPRDGQTAEITQDTISNWSSNVWRAWGRPIRNLQESLLALLLLVPGLATWRLLAAEGARTPSIGCSMCGKGGAMTGGARLGLVTGGAMTGGAALRVFLSSMTGGAFLDTRTGGAVTGPSSYVQYGGVAMTGGASL